MTVSSPGKLMLMGEHAVLYGQPCMVTAINQRLTVTVEQAGSTIDIQSPQTKDTRYIDAAVTRATREWQLDYQGLKITTESTFSGRYGFGSSSAVTVGVLTALAGEFGKEPKHEEIFTIGRQVVLDVAGKGSGFDIASAVWGGTLWFARGGTEIVDLPDFQDAALVVGYSGEKADTKSLIEEVSKKHKADTQKVERIMGAIGELVAQGREAYTQGDWKRLGTYMNFNQEYLRDLGVSTQKLEALVSGAKSAGAWGAKLSGAGGGDCMIAIGPRDTTKAIGKAIQNAGGEVVDVQPHAEGVRVES